MLVLLAACACWSTGAVPATGPSPHRHPGSVMVTLTSFRRRISAGGRIADVDLPAGQVRWLDTQEHAGENVGGTGLHRIFVELKDGGAASPGGRLGPVPS
jgi:hypothetical protein